MDVVTVGEKIEKSIEELKKMRLHFKDRSTKKANAIAEYDKELAITILKLRQGEEVEFEGKIIKDPPVSVLEKIAKGVVWQKKLELELAENNYKSLVTNIECVKSELNGLQSLNKHLE